MVRDETLKIIGLFALLWVAALGSVGIVYGVVNDFLRGDDGE